MKNLSRLLLVITAVMGFAVAVALVPIAGCSDNTDNQVTDMGLPDFALATQVAHVGVTGATCCMVTRGSLLAMYLTNVQVGMIDSRGHQHAATGQLHLVNPYGVDHVLGDDVPAFAYQFSADGNYAMYAVKTPTSKNNYSLNFATISTPSLPKPLVQTVIPDGIQDYALNQQSFFSDSCFRPGSSSCFLIIGVLRGAIANSPDLHVVDVKAAADVATLGNGAFDYLELVTPDDKMIYNNSTASSKPGTPSVEGMYLVNLAVFGNGNNNPSLIDTHVTNGSLMGDGQTLLYLRYNGDLMLDDLSQHFLVKVASNVMSFTAGPLPRGPIVWVGTDLSLHVANQFAAEMITLPPNSVDANTPFVFSADATRMYFFKNILQSNSNGDLYTVSIAPSQSRTPTFVGNRISTQDFNFFQDRFVYVRNVDSQGLNGELVSAALDGSQPLLLAKGVQLGGLRQANPNPPPPTGYKNSFSPVDLSPSIPQPIQAVLTNAKYVLDPSSTAGQPYAPVNNSDGVVGELSFGVSVVGRMGVIDPAVHTGMMRFSDDGYVLAYAGGAKWDATALNFVGTLKLQPTIVDTNPIEPNLDGVAELGTISNRSLFVSAPANAKPGIYFIKY